MTGYDDFDRTLAGWFEDDARLHPATGGLERVLDHSRRRSPQPAWLAAPGSHWVGPGAGAGSEAALRRVPGLDVSWSTVVIVVLLVTALVAGAILVGAGLFRYTPPPPSPISHLAYGLNGSMYVAEADGSNPVQIAQGTAESGGPDQCGSYWGEGSIWSPDGRYLAYRSAWDSTTCPSISGSVHISDWEGRPVASFPGTGWRIAWSPDSSRVVTWGTADGTIAIYGLDGVRRALLTGPGAGFGTYRDEDPIWSPDGTSILESLRPVPGGDPRQTWELPIDGGVPRPLPAGDPRSHWDGFSYSPDGTSVAYIEFGPPDLGCVGPGTCIEASSLVVAAADGSQPRVLINGGVGGVGGGPVWSPMGDRIAYAAQIAGETTNSGTSTVLRVVDVASGTVTSLADAGSTGGLSVIRFSPEGDRILFSRSDVNGDSSLWSVRSDGSDVRLLVAGAGWGDWEPLPAAH